MQKAARAEAPCIVHMWYNRIIFEGFYGNPIAVYKILSLSTPEGNILILTRRAGEILVIGDEIRVTLLGVKGDQVRIDVNTLKEISVYREEIYRCIQDEKL